MYFEHKPMFGNRRVPADNDENGAYLLFFYSAAAGDSVRPTILR